MPQPSYEDLEKRIRRLKARGAAHGVVVMTLQSLEGEDAEASVRELLSSLPLRTRKGYRQAVLLIVASRGPCGWPPIGAELEGYFAGPVAREKLREARRLYFNGMRPNMGIHSARLLYIRTIREKVKIDQQHAHGKPRGGVTSRGARGRTDLATLLAPFLTLFIGVLWGDLPLSTHYGVQHCCST